MEAKKGPVNTSWQKFIYIASCSQGIQKTPKTIAEKSVNLYSDKNSNGQYGDLPCI